MEHGAVRAQHRRAHVVAVVVLHAGQPAVIGTPEQAGDIVVAPLRDRRARLEIADRQLHRLARQDADRVTREQLARHRFIVGQPRQRAHVDEVERREHAALPVDDRATPVVAPHDMADRAEFVEHFRAVAVGQRGHFRVMRFDDHPAFRIDETDVTIAPRDERAALGRPFERRPLRLRAPLPVAPDQPPPPAFGYRRDAAAHEFMRVVETRRNHPRAMRVDEAPAAVQARGRDAAGELAEIVERRFQHPCTVRTHKPEPLANAHAGDVAAEIPYRVERRFAHDPRPLAVGKQQADLSVARGPQQPIVTRAAGPQVRPFGRHDHAPCIVGFAPYAPLPVARAKVERAVAEIVAMQFAAAEQIFIGRTARRFLAPEVVVRQAAEPEAPRPVAPVGGHVDLEHVAHAAHVTEVHAIRDAPPQARAGIALLVDVVVRIAVVEP